MEIPDIPIVPKVSSDSLAETVCRRSSVANHSVFDPKGAAHQRRSRRQAGRITAVIIVKTNTLFCNGIDVRSRVSAVAVTPHMIRPQRINIDK